MTDAPMKLVVNCETGEQELIPLTSEEIAQRELDRIESEAQDALRLQAEAEAQALKDSANAKLAALGLTAAEIAAITN